MGQKEEVWEEAVCPEVLVNWFHRMPLWADCLALGSRPYCRTRSQALGLIDGESWGANNVLSQTCKMRTLASPVTKFCFKHL